MMREQQVMRVNGMTCDGCERRITSALSGVDGVSADHESSTVMLFTDPDVTSTDVVRGVIEGLGYEMASR